jgi:hypothetical protein
LELIVFSLGFPWLEGLLGEWLWLIANEKGHFGKEDLGDSHIT